MSSDTAQWETDYTHCGEVLDKIVRLDDGSLLGSSGEVAIIQAYIAWARAGFPVDDKPEPGEKGDDFGAMLATTDGVFLIDHKFRRERVAGEFCVQGTGHEFAYGCLVAGASAPETVALAIKHFSHAAGRVVTHRLVPEDEAQPPEPTIDDVLDDEPIEPPAEGTKEYYGL
jgi:hypothetical protein